MREKAVCLISNNYCALYSDGLQFNLATATNFFYMDYKALLKIVIFNNDVPNDCLYILAAYIKTSVNKQTVQNDCIRFIFLHYFIACLSAKN